MKQIEISYDAIDYINCVLARFKKYQNPDILKQALNFNKEHEGIQFVISSILNENIMYCVPLTNCVGEVLSFGVGLA